MGISKSAKIVFMPDAILQQIQQIKKQLRLAMNGMTSDSMQERGLGYKVNYGVALTRLRQMGAKYGKNHDLAQKLWLENIRELRILASMIQPAETFTPEMANEWVADINQPEMAEQCAMNLFQHLPFASALVTEWLKQSDAIMRYTAWHLLARCIAKGEHLEDEMTSYFVVEALKHIQSGQLSLFNGALLALKRIGSKNINTARKILENVGELPQVEQGKQQQILEDLRFEFEYNLQTAL